MAFVKYSVNSYGKKFYFVKKGVISQDLYKAQKYETNPGSSVSWEILDLNPKKFVVTFTINGQKCFADKHGYASFYAESAARFETRDAAGAIVPTVLKNNPGAGCINLSEV